MRRFRPLLNLRKVRKNVDLKPNTVLLYFLQEAFEKKATSLFLSPSQGAIRAEFSSPDQTRFSIEKNLPPEELKTYLFSLIPTPLSPSFDAPFHQIISIPCVGPTFSCDFEFSGSARDICILRFKIPEPSEKQPSFPVLLLLKLKTGIELALFTLISFYGSFLIAKSVYRLFSDFIISFSIFLICFLGILFLLKTFVPKLSKRIKSLL